MHGPPLPPLQDSMGRGGQQTHAGDTVVAPEEAGLRELCLDRVVSRWEEVRVEGKT